MDLTQLVANAILSAAADAVVAIDRDGIIRVWNPGAVRIFGHHADEALGHSLDLIIPERLHARHWEGFHHVMATGASHDSPVTLVHRAAEYAAWTSRKGITCG